MTSNLTITVDDEALRRALDPRRAPRARDLVRTFFDTNVLVYLFDGDAPEKQGRARATLQEFYVAVSRKLAVPLDPFVAA